MSRIEKLSLFLGLLSLAMVPVAVLAASARACDIALSLSFDNDVSRSCIYQILRGQTYAWVS